MKKTIRLSESDLHKIVKESIKRAINETDMNNNIQQLVDNCVEYILKVKWGDELQSPTNYGVDNIEQDRQYLSKSLKQLIHNIM